jgi:hypothetical protein
MPLKGHKKSALWPTPQFIEDLNIYIYIAIAIKKLKVLKKYYNLLIIKMPKKILIIMIKIFLYLAY